MKILRIICHLLIFLASSVPVSLFAAQKPLVFGVITQRSLPMTAQYWNPILIYLEKKTGIPLQLRVEKNAPDHSKQVRTGRYDLVYSNHIFTRKNTQAGYRVIVRPAGAAIAGEIVVPEDSPITRIEELVGKEVGFPSPVAFVGYTVPMDALMKLGLKVTPVFAGNQEGIMAQLKARKVVAASVNSRVMQEYAARERFEYRTIWKSQEFLNIPIAVHPRVSSHAAAALQAALVEMVATAEGRQILEQGGGVIGQSPPYGFIRATNHEYQNQWDFFKKTMVPEP